MAISASDLVSPEKQLLVCSSQTRIGARAAEKLQRLLALSLDWDAIVAAAAEHGVAPLLFRTLSFLGPNAVPSADLTRLKDHVRAASVHSLVLTAELIRILDVLASQGVEAIPYKGPVLAAQAYGDVALREFADIDLVLRQRDIAEADLALTDLGYSPQFPPIFAPGKRASLVPGEYNYCDTDRRISVELHTERTLRHFPAPPDLAELGTRLVPVCLSGHAIRTFSPEDTLVLLCVHGSKDFWERLVWVADVAELVGSCSQFDWNRVDAVADAVGARRMLNIGLALAGGLFEISLPDEVRLRVHEDATAGLIAAELQRRLLARTTPPLGARATFSYRLQMVPGLLAGLGYAARLATSPAAEDWHSVRLPRPLALLYAAMRPIRLLKKYGASGRVSARPFL